MKYHQRPDEGSVAKVFKGINESNSATLFMPISKIAQRWINFPTIHAEFFWAKKQSRPDEKSIA